MRDAFGGAFMIKLMLIFLVIYVCFIAVALNYAKAFKAKNGIIDLIENSWLKLNHILERFKMIVCYDKLWKLLIDKKMKKSELKDKAGISFNVLAKMGKGETVSLESLHKVCMALECNIGDIMEFSDDDTV